MRPLRKRVTARRYVWVFLVVGVLVCGGLYVVQMGRHGGAVPFGSTGFNTSREAGGKAKWAQRVELAGVENFHKVSEQLYRGAQPSAEGMEQLKKLGIKTVINLRSFHSDKDEIGDANLAYEHIYMKPWHLEDKGVVRFLNIVSDPNRTPVFVHCQRGADRTGTMCAIYRIAAQGWSKAEAIEEMTKGGFGFYRGWQNIVNYILKLDIEEIKREAGPE